MSKTTDIYDISQEISDIQSRYMPEDQDVMSVGMYGYLSDQFATIIQNNIFMTSEYANEAFPTRARFEKTILSNAISYNINNINATPATMDVYIGVIKSELDRILDNRSNPVYIIPTDTPININLMNFRLENDLQIVRKKRINGEYTYYGINKKPGEDTIVNDNAYLPVPVFMEYMNEKYIFFNSKLKQVEVTDVNKKLISGNIIDNKAVDFTYKDQLHKFDVIVEEPGGNKVKVKPIFEGEYIHGEKWCTYYFVNNNTIRVKFSRKSYMPKANSNVKIRIYTTNGGSGNIKHRSEVLFTAADDGKVIKGIILPNGDAYDGINSKSMDELKNIIPKERLSRGILSNDRDLENYFNIMDSNSKLKFFKKRHNQIERCYYSYLLVKDSKGNIIPTNTNDVRLTDNNFTENKKSYTLPPNTPFLLSSEDGFCYPIDYDMEAINTFEQYGFVYTNPFIMVMNKKPLSVQYYLNVLDELYQMSYDYINIDSEVQFMSSKIRLYKNHIFDNNNYYISFTIKPNITVNSVDDTDPMSNVLSKLKPVIILNQNGFKYYIEGTIEKGENLTADNTNRNSYNVLFKLNTDNIVHDDGINILNVSQFGTKNKVNIHVSESISAEFYLYMEPLDGKPAILNNTYELPYEEYEKYNLISKMSIMNDKIRLYYDYSDIINSVSTLEDTVNLTEYDFSIKGVPMVKYSYMQNISTCDEFIKYIHKRYIYIGHALDRLDNNFTIDFKFFNTYGPSKMFNIGRDGEALNKINIGIKFAYRPKLGANKYIVEYMTDSARQYIENINEIKSIHISNLIAYLKDKYSSDIEFIEFVGINDYDTSYQYMEKKDELLGDKVPEFININMDKNGVPDIEFRLV